MDTKDITLDKIEVNLVPEITKERTRFNIKSLEEMRIRQATVPASKYGLEAICGASCETSAQ